MLEAFRANLASMLVGKSGSPSYQAFVERMGMRSAPARGSAELIAAYKTSPWLRMVVSKIASAVASVPWALYKPNGKGAGATVRRSLAGAHGDVWREAFKALKQEGTLIPIENDPITAILNGPNPVLSGLAVRRVTQVWLELKGEAFWIYERDRSNRIAEVWPAAPHWVKQTVGGLDPAEKFTVEMFGKRLNVASADMLWIKDPDPADPYGRGTGTGESLGDEIETDEYASKYLKTFFYNSARPEMIFMAKGADKAQLTAMRQEFEGRFRGIGKQHQTAWFPNEIEIKELQQSLGKLGMTDLRSWERNAVVNAFGVPPEIVGILENSNRATSIEAQRIFAEQVLCPRLEFYRAEVQHKLVDREGIEAVLGYESPSPVDTERRDKILAAAPWALTRREIRQELGQADRGPADDVYMVPLNLVEVPAPTVKSLGGPAAVKVLDVPRHKDINERDVENALEQLRPERLASKVRGLWSDELKLWMSETLTDLGLDPGGFDLLNPKTLEHMQEFLGDRIRGINDTTKGQLRDSLLEGVRAGEGIDDLAARVAATMDIAKGSRAEIIARTEVTRSGNFGTYQAQLISGIVPKRSWVGTKDGRERDATDELDGTEVAIDEPFTYQGHEAMHPGDFGDPALDCNCRCTTRAIIAGKSMDANAVWQKFDRGLIPWERAARGAFARGFADQRSDVLAALRRLA